MNRRKFLESSAAAMLVPILGREAGGSQPRSDAGKMTDAEKKARIGVCTWSLHNYFPMTREKDFKCPGKMLDLREFPALIAEKYGIHNFELGKMHFESTSPSYLNDLKAAVAKAHGRIINMPVDMLVDWQGGGLSDPDEKQWRWEIEERKKWIDVAAELGAQSIRPNPGGTEQMTDLSRPVAAYKELADYGKSKGVKVFIENHGKVSAKAENIVAIIQGVGSGWVGALPDFGNFPESERYHGLELMFPLAQTVCHVRGHAYNERGEETRIDFPRCVRIAQAAGFKGVYSIEYAGHEEPYDAVQKIIDQLLELS